MIESYPRSDFVIRDFYKKHKAVTEPIAVILMIIAAVSLFLLCYNALVEHYNTGKNLLWFSSANYNSQLSDEMGYFLQIKSMVEKGIVSENAGYFGYWYAGDVYLARYLNYGAQGMFAILPYYLVGEIFGWNELSPIISNIAFLILAFLVFYLGVKSVRKTAAVIAVSLTFLPCIMYFGTGMMEVLMYSFSIALAGLICGYYKHPSRAKEAVLIALIFIASLLRITNFVFFIPLIIKKAEGKSKRYYFLYSVLSIAAAAVAYIANNGLVAVSYPINFLNQALGELFAGNVGTFIVMLLKKFLQNSWFMVNPAYQEGFFTFSNYAFMTIAALLFAGSFWRLDWSGKKLRRREKATLLSLSASLTMLALSLINNVLYEAHGYTGFRVLMPFVLFAVVVALVSYKEHMATAAVCVCICAVLFANIGQTAPFIEGHYNAGDSFIPQSISSQIVYNPDADSRWENTVLTPCIITDEEAGIGLIYTLSTPREDCDSESKYMLLQVNQFDYENFTLVLEEDGYFLFMRNEYL
jgi:hypothetical protein